MNQSTEPSNGLIVLTVCPSSEVAETIANQLVAKRLAACVNIIPGVMSVYRWKNQIEQDNEVLLLIKSTANQYSALEQLIKQQHPYELPEIIAVSVEVGSAAYLQWLSSSCHN